MFRSHDPREIAIFATVFAVYGINIAAFVLAPRQFIRALLETGTYYVVNLHKTLGMFMLGLFIAGAIGSYIHDSGAIVPLLVVFLLAVVGKRMVSSFIDFMQFRFARNKFKRATRKLNKKTINGPLKAGPACALEEDETGQLSLHIVGIHIPDPENLKVQKPAYAKIDLRQISRLSCGDGSGSAPEIFVPLVQYNFATANGIPTIANAAGAVAGVAFAAGFQMNALNASMNANAGLNVYVGTGPNSGLWVMNSGWRYLTKTQAAFDLIRAAIECGGNGFALRKRFA
ncbi:hypothetical protein OPU71_10200 [Niveibacterium sp. 24ML]|uniref:hypothetical protein n=1 Tax=Niveibacterium sp. 24ML TaxID=2985512 RepID=UPI00226E97F2|nr:hypothetical protein [Niveibacterium sp. 24ML]MCX9156492.1 hypothetical protein [Niveibacterium sp. 24ML]